MSASPKTPSSRFEGFIAKVKAQEEGSQGVDSGSDSWETEHGPPGRLLKQKQKEVEKGLVSVCKSIGWEYAEAWVLSEVSVKPTNPADQGQKKGKFPPLLSPIRSMGRALRRNADKWSCLTPLATVTTDGASASAGIQKFKKNTANYKFPLGVGQPGRLFQSGLPEFLPDVETESYSRFQRRGDAVEAGFHSSLAVPVLWRDSVSGRQVVAAVLVFFSCEVIRLQQVQQIVKGTLQKVSKIEVLNMDKGSVAAMIDEAQHATALERIHAPDPTKVALDAMLRCTMCGDICNLPTALLPCMHTFCGGCVENWCRSLTRCPRCEEHIEAVHPNEAMEEALDTFLQELPEYKRATAEVQSRFQHTIEQSVNLESPPSSARSSAHNLDSPVRSSSTRSPNKPPLHPGLVTPLPGSPGSSLRGVRRPSSTNSISIKMYMGDHYGSFGDSDTNSPGSSGQGAGGAEEQDTAAAAAAATQINRNKRMSGSSAEGLPRNDSNSDTWWEDEAAHHREATKALDADDFLSEVTWSQFQEHTPCLAAIERAFPGAQPALEAKRRALCVLAEEGFEPDKTLFGNSTCPDEINRVRKLWSHFSFGDSFSLGGLAGIPFAGKTGFAAYSHHMPDGGGLLILYASHVGVSRTGKVGYVERHGMGCAGKACGAAIGAYGAVCDNPDLSEPASSSDYQQWFVTRTVKAQKRRIDKARDAMAELPIVIYDRIRWELLQMIPPDFTGRLALLGGVQINTPAGIPEHFLVRNFETVIYDNEKGMMLNDLKGRMAKVKLSTSLDQRTSAILQANMGLTNPIAAQTTTSIADILTSGFMAMCKPAYVLKDDKEGEERRDVPPPPPPPPST